MALAICRINSPNCQSKKGQTANLWRCDHCKSVGCWNCIAAGGCKVCRKNDGKHSQVR